MKPHNFSAGPAALPALALERAQAEFLSLNDSGLSVLEISHRSQAFVDILQQTEARLRDLLAVPEGYHILFLQGGASLQFAMLPMNFLHQKAGYVDCGSWAKKALAEARIQGNAEVLWSDSEAGYRRMPTAEEWSQWQSQSLDYIHITSNETIQGVALQQDLPRGKVPVFCDMSSDILSRPVDVSQYDVIYAGAQKNMGPAGVTVVIIKDELLKTAREKLPTMLDYRTHVSKNSAYNTPPVFAIYMLNQVTQWLQEQGGLNAMYRHNQQQASAVYNVLDQYPDFYRGHATPEYRSLMNITFTLPTHELEAQFLAAAEAEGLLSLKGHRSVGGIRASIYNACPQESVQALVEFLQRFYRSVHARLPA